MLLPHRVRVKNILNLYISVLLKNNNNSSSNNKTFYNSLDDDNKSHYGNKCKFTLWYTSTSITITALLAVNLGNTGLLPHTVYKSEPEVCGFTTNCCKVAPRLPQTQKSLRFHRHLWWSFKFYTCAFCVCLDAGVCSGICVYFMTNIKVYDPIMSVHDWKPAVLWIFGQDSIIGFN